MRHACLGGGNDPIMVKVLPTDESPDRWPMKVAAELTIWD